MPDLPVNRELHWIHKITDHPKWAGFIAFLTLAATFSPKVSLIGMWACIVCAILTGSLGLKLITRPGLRISSTLALTVLSVLYGVWLTPTKESKETNEWRLRALNVPSFAYDKSRQIARHHRILTDEEILHVLKKYDNEQRPSPCPFYTPSQLKDELRADGTALSDVARAWQANDSREYLPMTDYVYAHGTDAQRAEADKRWNIRKKQITAEWIKRSKGLVSRANDCRLEVIRRIPTVQDTVWYDDGNKLFGKLLLGSDGLMPGDLNEASNQLDGLAKQIP